MRLPGPLRAAVGLVASASDEAKHLPDRAIELPMMAVSTALQLSLRAQQRYARLAARGDAVLNRSRPSEDPPPWATFDDPVSIEELRRGVLDDTGLGAESSKLLQDIFGVDEPDTATSPDNGASPPAPTAESAAAARKTPAKKTAPARKAPTTKKAHAEESSAAKPAEGKTVSKPRHTPPSAFDNAADD